MTRRVSFDRRFDLLMALPLATYALAMGALVIGVFSGVTAAALKTALSDRALWAAVRLSFATTAVSTAMSVAVAIPAGYVLSRARFRGIALVDTLLDLPIVLPPLVMGLSLLIFFNTPFGRFLDRGIRPQGLFVYQPGGIVLAQFVVGCAFAVRVMKAGYDALDQRYEEVAMTLGADRGQAFRKAVLPNVLPSLVAGGVIAWAKIFGLFGPVLMIAGTMRGRTEIMPTTIFLETSIGRFEVALVIGSMMILMSMAVLMALKRFGGRRLSW